MFQTFLFSPPYAVCLHCLCAHPCWLSLLQETPNTLAARLFIPSSLPLTIPQTCEASFDVLHDSPRTSSDPFFKKFCSFILCGWRWVFIAAREGFLSLQRVGSSGPGRPAPVGVEQGASLFCSMWDLPGSGIKLVSVALEGRLPSTVFLFIFKFFFLIYLLVFLYLAALDLSCGTQDVQSLVVACGI